MSSEKDDVSFLEFLKSKNAISQTIAMLRPPNLAGWENNIGSRSQQV